MRDAIKYINNRDIDDDVLLYSPLIDDGSIEGNSAKSYGEKAYKYALDMTIKETQQAVEGMYHNLNTLQSRSGN